MKTIRRTRPSRERGMAVAMIMTVLGVLMLMGLVSLGVMMASLRTTGAHRAAAQAHFCAEAGLVAGRTFFAQNVGSWNTYLQCNSTYSPSCAGYPMVGSAGADGSASYSVSIVDNYDELPPLGNDPTTDSDLTVVMVAQCTDPNLPRKTLQEYYTYDLTLMPDYRSQSGFGRANTGNQN